MSWQAGSLALLALILLGGFAWYERRRPPAKVLALVAALAALAVVGRIAFAAVPNVKPTTDIVLFAGYALGAVPGFAVGAVTALVSNLFLGQGPWTVWQMTGWGAVGASGALVARILRGDEPARLPLALACGAAGLAFGAWMDVYQWTLAARQDLGTYVAVSGTSLPYNLAHAIGNVVFCLLIGPAFVRALARYRRRFEVRWLAPATAALLLVLALPAAAGAASSSARAARYLERAQNRDGGLGPAPRQPSNQLHTGWSALGLASARINPRDVRRRGGPSIVAYVRRNAGRLDDTGDLERTILVLRAAGLSPRSFAGRNLVAELVRRRRDDGSWNGNVTFTAFGVLALRAAGEPVAGASTAFLAGAQNEDGGFGFVPSAVSDVDDTGAVLQALRRGGVALRALAYLRSTQNGDGGFGQMKGRGSNSQSTAWAVQGLVAAGARGGAVGRALAYLKGLQRRDGSISYSRTSRQTPVWVTAQALTALRRRPFPLAPAPRRRKARRSTAAPAPAGADRGRPAPRRRAGARPTGRHPATPAPVVTERARPEEVASRAAGARPRDEDGGGPSAVLIALAVAGALGSVSLARRRLPHAR